VTRSRYSFWSLLRRGYHRLGEEIFELHVDRSLADHLEGWLAPRNEGQEQRAMPTRH
jgi:hypothetical protein